MTEKYGKYSFTVTPETLWWSTGSFNIVIDHERYEEALAQGFPVYYLRTKLLPCTFCEVENMRTFVKRFA